VSPPTPASSGQQRTQPDVFASTATTSSTSAKCPSRGLRGSVSNPLPYTIREFKTRGYYCDAPNHLQAEAICLRLYRERGRHFFWELKVNA